jgi:hypothetical protein
MASRALKIDPAKSEEKTLINEMSNESVRPTVSSNVGEIEIAALAYEYWQERGCPIGSDQEDWFRTEETLRTRARSISTAA